MSKHGFVSLSCMRRQCGTCDQWQGKHQIELAEDNQTIVAADKLGGECRDGAWRNFSTLPHQTCDQYIRWEALLDEPSDPVVLSTISQLHREIRMQSHLANALPDELCEKLDDLLWEIERWHIQHLFAGDGKAEMERAWFFDEFVSGVFDCFYYFGWSRRKPVAGMSLVDIWPLYRQNTRRTLLHKIK